MKHGIESHFVRPDRVYATSVLSPITGYEPVNDAMQVAARFVGNGRGLAGPSSEVQLMGRKGGQAVRALFTSPRGRGLRGAVTLLGALASPFQGLRDWLNGMLANIRARWEARKVLKQLVPVGAGAGAGKVVTLDTSPRATGAATAVTAAGALPPAHQSPASAAARIMPALPAPYTSSSAIAAVIAPGAHAMNQKLNNLWRWGA